MAELEFEPFETEWRYDAYAIYRRLRDEAPVYRSPGSGTYCVSRYDDVLDVLKQPELFSSGIMQSLLMGPRLGRPKLRDVGQLWQFLVGTRFRPMKIIGARNLITLDPPRHGAVRAIVNRGFSPRRIAGWEARIREVVTEELAGVASTDPFDVVQQLAIPLPTRIIAEILGIEPERRGDFKRWSDAVIEVASGPGRHDPLGHGFLANAGALFGFLGDTVRARRANPGDDLVSLLVDPRQKDILAEADVIQFLLLLLVAGNETTTNLIGNGANALLDHPEALDRVAGDPALIPGMIEEALRYDAPVQLVFRGATRDTEIAGTPIPKGAAVCIIMGSANRDERRFEDPDAFDVTRDTRGHLGFGHGTHFCLGASLARLEAKAAFEALVPLLVGARRAAASPPLIVSFLVRGRSALRLEAA